jgi:3-oxoadipate CoA-transferase beta subunit
MKPLSRRQIAWRAAQDLGDGSYVNLGLGLPTLVADFIPDGREIVFHSENGVLGLGRAPGANELDPDLINAGKGPASLLPGGSFFHHTDAFLMIRGGHLDYSLLGAFEVSGAGDLANWTAGAKEVRVLCEHTTKDGQPRIRNACSYPLTAAGVVKRVYTNLAVLDIGRDGVLVREMVEGLGLAELQAKTEPALRLADDWKSIAAPSI